MSEDDRGIGPDEIRRILRSHLELGPTKSTSYLPIATIDNLIGMTVAEYLAAIEQTGNVGVAFGPSQCCIKSGAVYAFSSCDLRAVLEHNRASLVESHWPVAPMDFINKIASEWIDNDHPVMSIIKEAFGDA
jgi:hypothetical protein